MSEDYEDILDTEVSGDRLVTYQFRDFLATLDGIEFGPITFDDNEVFGASFLNNEQNHDKIKAAGYSLMISDKISVKDRLNILEELKKNDSFSY